MHLFYNKKYCDRCHEEFKHNVLKMPSWFTNECICSTKCTEKEKNLLVFLGKEKYKYKDCGYVPTLEQIVQLEAYKGAKNVN